MCYESDKLIDLHEKMAKLQEEVTTHLRERLVEAALKIKNLQQEIDGFGDVY